MKRLAQKKSKFNRQYILEKGIATEHELNQLTFDQGIRFLEIEFEEDERWISEYSRDPLFWKWWRMEWDNQLANIVAVTRVYRSRISRKSFLKAMNEVIHHSRTHHGFHTYLKTTRNVKLPSRAERAIEVETA